MSTADLELVRAVEVADVYKAGVLAARLRRRRDGVEFSYLPGYDGTAVATTLPVETANELSMIVELYSSRWAIETFFFSFKQSLRAEGFRVFSCWEALDRLLALAHMAFLVLSLVFLLAQKAQTGAWAGLWRRFERWRREWFARPGELGLGEFFRLVGMDCAERGLAWGPR